MEKHLQEALPLVDPNAKRGYITNTLGGLGDRKTLLKLTETDRNVTQCLRELVEALHALQIAELSAALDVQHRLGPELVYELLHVREDLHVKKTNLCGDHVDASSQNETEGNCELLCVRMVNELAKTN